MKTLCTALVVVFAAGVVVTGGASADSNDLTFNQTQGADGQYHIDIGVSYVFPGQPPRNYNYGLGTVRITLPGSDLTLDPAQPADPGYTCNIEFSGSAICSADGQSNGAGLNFPTSITVHLLSKSCWSAAGGHADVWSAPNDPGTAPDVTLPIDQPDCAADNTTQPVLDTKPLKCTVPKLKNASLQSATRQLANAKCARGKVTFKHSAKVKKNHVISQSIKPGKVLKEKTKVNLVVSRG